MSADKAFFDTNILVYTRDRADAKKQQIAAQLFNDHLRHRTLWLSTQVLQEFFVTVSRKIKGVTLDEAYSLTSELAKLHVTTVSAGDVLEAIALQRRHNLSFWDSLIVISAQKVGAHSLFSEDMNHGQVFGTVRIENPFLTRDAN